MDDLWSGIREKWEVNSVEPEMDIKKIASDPL